MAYIKPNAITDPDLVGLTRTEWWMVHDMYAQGGIVKMGATKHSALDLIFTCIITPGGDIYELVVDTESFRRKKSSIVKVSKITDAEHQERMISWDSENK